MPQPPFNIAEANRWFAAHWSDRTGELLQSQNRTASETEKMIHAGHAAVLHAQAAGDGLVVQRALTLLATCYLKAGQGEAALKYAQQSLALREQSQAAESPLDRASAFAVAAKAFNLAGNGNESLRLIMLALEEAERLPEAERELFDRLYGEP